VLTEFVAPHTKVTGKMALNIFFDKFVCFRHFLICYTGDIKVFEYAISMIQIDLGDTKAYGKIFLL